MAPTAAVLLDVLQRGSRSLLLYVSEAFPWATTEERAALAQLLKLIAQEQQSVNALGRFLIRRGVMPPPLPPYPMDFANINYVSFDHLLPLLVENQHQAVARLERARDALAAGDARAQVEQLLTIKGQHLQTLTSMTAAQSEKANAQPAAAST